MSNTTGLHVAIIPDGNRRWARANKLKHVWLGHKQAVVNFGTLTDWCLQDPRIATLTIWCFSTENWKRDPAEVAELMNLLETYLESERNNLLQKNIRFVHSGRRDRIPGSLVKLIEAVEQETSMNTAFTLHLAVDYGGKDEIIRATNKFITSKKDAEQSLLTEENLRDFLDQPELPDIDLILRTSGEQRTSNFFLWQSTYAEWVFTPKYFPDITTKDLDEALTNFVQRSRRFGG